MWTAYSIAENDDVRAKKYKIISPKISPTVAFTKQTKKNKLTEPTLFGGKTWYFKEVYNYLRMKNKIGTQLEHGEYNR